MNILKHLLYIRKSDRVALLFLLCLVVAGSAIVYVVGGGDDGSLVAENDTMHNDTVYVYRDGRRYYKSDSSRYAYPNRGSGGGYIYDTGERKPQGELFYFDPNTADSTDLLRLGLAPWQVRNIYRYRNKGGVYREPRDFAKLYGLTAGDYKRLEPYIRIAPEFQPAASMTYNDRDEHYERDTLLYPIKLRPGQTVPVNSADTSLLKKVPGIGSGYSRAITSYREQLGGYYSLDQLCEIKGFPEGSIDFFVLDSCVLRKININKLTVNQLKRHPYINFYQAKAIVDYRRLHGDIKSLRELSLQKDFPEEAIKRLEPYIEY